MVFVFRRLMGVKHGSEEESSEEEDYQDREEGQEALASALSRIEQKPRQRKRRGFCFRESRSPRATQISAM
ncbi:MAG TPA: hypothetical protein VN632_04885 [Stellaceae bacterium]|nr:hypothetical protein [Stellaceae bacterium]